MNVTKSSQWDAVESRLQEIEAPEIVVRTFRRQYERLCQGDDAFVRESDIRPAENVSDAEQLPESTEAAGQKALSQTAVLKLNGGLGTSMGLEAPKSLLPVRGDQTFLDLIVSQSEKLGVPLVLMNSFATDQMTQTALKDHAADNILTFLQHQVPKIDAETMRPADWPSEPELTWCPPGHGDIYAALLTSGTLDQLLADGRRYLFVSNADNLGATLDVKILGHFVTSGSSFMMEVADRTLADRKGGHLASTADGKLLLREKAQCHPDEEESFQDISRHRYFNTNNLWIDLQVLKETLTGKGIDLPLIANRKTVDPKDSSSPAVFQLETAMGAAIEQLPSASAIRIPRSRFAPVKTTGDLIAVRSDAYEIRSDASVRLADSRQGKPPVVKLDDAFYKKLADLQQRIPRVPSLLACDSLSVDGDVTIDADVRFEGHVVVVAGDGPKQLAAGTYSSNVDLA